MFHLNLAGLAMGLGTSMVAATMCADAAQAQQSSQADYALPAQDLAQSLRQVSVKSGVSVIVPGELVAGKTAAPLSGRFDAQGAVERLLEGSDLQARPVGNTIVIAPASGAGLDRDPDSRERDTIVVTGSHLRGASPTSPLIRITRREIEQRAPASVEELMRGLPQNLSSGVGQENFGVSGAGADITEHGAGVNLRGLGQRATLVLVNGRRIAPSGTGSLVDISMIPVTAIDRVEILTDGASAIYGSDAVGGVVNLILRDDFDGVETLVQGATTTHGDGEQWLASATGGAGWGSGRAMLSYEFRKEGEILASDRNFTINLPDGWALFPSERRHSLYGAARQELAHNLSLDASGMFAQRDSSRSFFIAGPTVPVEVTARARSYGASATLVADLGHSWVGQLGGSYFRTRTKQEQFQPQGQGLVNLLNTSNTLAEAELKINGDLAELPAGPVKLAFGGLVRREKHESLFETPVNLPTPEKGARTVRSLYGEVQIPLFSERNRGPGLEKLVVSAAARLDDYDRLKASIDPKLGFLWSPVRGLDLRASYATSFRAPLLSETIGLYNAFLFPAALLFIDPSAAPTGVGAALVGSNPDVKPETSKSWSAGFEWSPPAVSRLRLGVTYYSIRYSNRIARPTEQIVVVGDPALEPIVTRNPAVGLVAGLLDGAGQVIDVSGPDFTFGGATPEDVVIIVDARFSNTAETRTSGLDVSLNYGFGLGGNEFQLGLNANKVFKFDDRLTSATPVIHTLNTPFHPVDWRAQASLAWSRGPLSGSLLFNYTAPYRDTRGNRNLRVGSFTTVDAGLAYAIPAGGMLGNLRIGMNVRNLLDEDPPRLLPEPGFTRDIGYDPVNATGRGRTVSLQVRKSW